MIVAPVRAVIGAPVTLTFTSVDSDGEPSDVDPGVVTVGVEKADGTVLVAAGTATTGSGATRSYTLPATSELDRLTVTWTASAVAIGTTTVDVVGGVFATLAEIRAIAPTLGDTSTDTDVALLRVRAEVEAMIDRAAGGALSFVPRFATATMWHGGQKMLQLPHYFLRRIRWARYWYDTADPTDVESSLLTGIQPNDAGLALLYDASEAWPTGRVVVGYEHGLDAPPLDVKRQAVAAIRRGVSQSRSAVDSRAMSYTSPTGETQRFPTPGLGPWVTGVPEIDEVLRWYADHYPVMSV